MTSHQQLAASCTFLINNGSIREAVDSTNSVGQLRLAAGQLIENKYKILSMLGQGGMGAVYKAQHLLLQKEVALKTFRSREISEEAWRRFLREAKAIARLQHKNIVHVYDFGSADDNLPYYTMEVLEGESLAQYIERVGRLSPYESLSIFAQAAEALAYAHRQMIVHRDIKPANIFLQTQPNGLFPLVKIVDFGIAKLVEDASAGGEQGSTQAGIVFGSPLYMSPEQSLGKVVDQRTDIYSFGCALFESLTGQPPFCGESALATLMQHQTKAPPKLAEFLTDVRLPQRLEGLIARVLAKDPARRFQNFDEIVEEIVVCLNEFAGQPERDKKNSSYGQKSGAKSSETNNNEERDFEGPTANAPSVLGLSSITTLIIASAACIFVAALGIAFSGNQKLTRINKTSTAKVESVGQFDHSPIVPETQVGKFSEPSPGADFSRERAATLANNKPFMIGVKNGQRRFKFPTYAPIGRFLDDEARYLAICQGDVSIAANQKLVFIADPEVALAPAYFDRLPGELMDTVKLAKDPADRWADSQFQHIRNFHNLVCLDVSFASKVTEKSLPMIGRFQQLYRLDISHSGIKSADLVGLANLRRILAVTMNESGDASRFFSLVHKDAAAMKLAHIAAHSCMIDDADIAQLNNLKSLRFLYVDDNKITGTTIDQLQALEGLEILSLKKNPLKPDAIEKLAKLRRLKRLTVDDSYWPMDAVDQLRAKMPGCNIIGVGDQ